MQDVIKIVGAVNFSRIGTIGIEDYRLQLIFYCFKTFGCAVNFAMCGWKHKKKILKRTPFGENICGGGN